MVAMPSQQRSFTRAEDELIVKNSSGQLNIKLLRRILRANVTTIQRRANELGVKLCFKREGGGAGGRKAGTFPSTHDNLTPARIKDDKLLARLRQIHGEESQ